MNSYKSPLFIGHYSLIN